MVIVIIVSVPGVCCRIVGWRISAPRLFGIAPRLHPSLVLSCWSGCLRVVWGSLGSAVAASCWCGGQW